VFTNWLLHLVWGRDFTSVRKVQTPREFFEEFATRPATARTTKAKATSR